MPVAQAQPKDRRDDPARDRLEHRARHVRVWNFFRPPVSAIARRMFDYRHDDLSGVKGPYLLLCNHVTDFDPILVGMAMHHQGYYVASEHIMRKPLIARLLTWGLCPIIHQKGRQGLRSTKEILRTLKGGASVVLFPEGNRSFDGTTCVIPAVTGKLALKCGATLVTMRLEGGYLTQPRWGTTRRRGGMYGRVMGVYPPEQLAAMTPEEAQTLVCRDLQEDAFERQRVIERETGRMPDYVGKCLAEGLEAALFVCPECGAISSITTQEDRVSCACGLQMRYLGTGFLEGGRFDTVAEWYGWQRGQLDDKIDAAPCGEAVLFEDRVSVELVCGHDVDKRWEGTLRASPDGFVFVGDDGRERVLRHDDIVGAAVHGRNTLVAHVGDGEGDGDGPRHYEVRGPRSFCALKYLYVYRHAGGEVAGV